MLHWGWESAAESPGPWSVGCSLEGNTGGNTGREEDEGRCAVEIVSVTGEKMPSQSLLLLQQHLTPELGSLSVLLRASSAVTGVVMSVRSQEIPTVCNGPASDLQTS